MKLKEIYNIQATADFSVRAGHTPDEAIAAELWVDRIGHLAAHLGWDYEIVPLANADDPIFGQLWESLPTVSTYHRLVDTYGMAGLVVTNGPICMTDNE